MDITKKRLEEEKEIMKQDTARFRELPQEFQEKALIWIRANVFPGKKPLLDTSSYGMKHILEYRTGIYMTNNQFKEAMLLCGFFPVDKERLNWCYRISKKSPIYIFQDDMRYGLRIPECETWKKTPFGR